MTNQKHRIPLPIEAQHVGFFETPVAYCRLKEGEAPIQELEKAIRQNRAQDDGLTRSNFGG
jgi:hypothetical protein